MRVSPLISVIIPVYNVEKYLQRCLDSVIEQTYQNLEIILIDDGSTDHSGKICDDYAARDMRIHVIHQENQGLSIARNKGLDIAKGTYIAFVDSDDYILPEMYAKMLECIIENDVDFCVCQWQYEYADGRQVVQRDKISPAIYGKHSSIEFAHFLFRGSYENGVVVAVWNKLYHKNAIDSLRFDGRRAEDDEFNDKINSLNLRTYVMPDQFYVYVQNTLSLTNTPFSADQLHFLNVLEKRQKLFSDDSFIRQETEKLYCNIYIEYYYKAKAAGIPFPHTYRRIFRRMFSALCSEDACNVKFRLRMCLFLLSPTLYKLLTKH